jgi:hypothetical protein
MRLACILLAATLSSSCGGDKESKPIPPPPPSKPIRGAVGDEDLRVMLAEIASAKACEMIRGSFRGLRSQQDRNVTTGVLWTRECKITNDGTKVTFQLGGQGWQWAEQSEKKAGAKFELREYIKFDIDATIKGTLDMAYDRVEHIVSLWFTPTETPKIQFRPIGDVDVDEKGTWSSVVGGLSSVFLESPDEQGKQKADEQGTQEFTNQLAQGMTVAINLCTGYQRFTTGRPQKGSLGPADPGETTKKPIEIQPGGLLAFGPYAAPNGMSIDVHSNGPVRVGLACADDVYATAEDFIAERPQELVKTLAKSDVNGKAHLEVKPQKCKVAVVARSFANTKVTFDWQRPAREIARSTGGPAIHCGRDKEVSSTRDAASGRASARRR